MKTLETFLVIAFQYYCYSANAEASIGYIGCFWDIYFFRGFERHALERQIYDNKTNIAYKGKQRCINFRYAGTKGTRCFCGNNVRTWKNNGGQCNSNCPGRNDEKCGGMLTISIYDITVKSLLPTSSTNFLTSLTGSTYNRSTTRAPLPVLSPLTTTTLLSTKLTSLFVSTGIVTFGSSFSMNKPTTIWKMEYRPRELSTLATKTSSTKYTRAKTTSTAVTNSKGTSEVEETETPTKWDPGNRSATEKESCTQKISHTAIYITLPSALVVAGVSVTIVICVIKKRKQSNRLHNGNKQNTSSSSRTNKAHELDAQSTVTTTKQEKNLGDGATHYDIACSRRFKAQAEGINYQQICLGKYQPAANDKTYSHLNQVKFGNTDSVVDTYSHVINAAMSKNDRNTENTYNHLQISSNKCGQLINSQDMEETSFYDHTFKGHSHSADEKTEDSYSHMCHVMA